MDYLLHVINFCHNGPVQKLLTVLDMYMHTLSICAEVVKCREMEKKHKQWCSHVVQMYYINVINVVIVFQSNVTYGIEYKRKPVQG